MLSMKKGNFGIKLSIIAALAFAFVVIKQPLLVLLVAGFAIVAEKDEWLTRQVLQAVLLYVLYSAASIVLGWVFTGLGSLFSFASLYGVNSVFITIGSGIDWLIYVGAIVFAIIAILNVLKGKDANIPIIAGMLDGKPKRKAPPARPMAPGPQGQPGYGQQQQAPGQAQYGQQQAQYGQQQAQYGQQQQAQPQGQAQPQPQAQYSPPKPQEEAPAPTTQGSYTGQGSYSYTPPTVEEEAPAKVEEVKEAPIEEAEVEIKEDLSEETPSLDVEETPAEVEEVEEIEVVDEVTETKLEDDKTEDLSPRFCTQCGATLDPDSRFCTQCGNPA